MSQAHEWARWRPISHRTPIPQPGQRVWYRAVKHGPLVGATVLDLPDAVDDDWNVWRVRVNPDTATPVRPGPNVPIAADSRAIEHEQWGPVILDRHPDHWPDLLLKVDGQSSHVITREARLRGSAGWLPLDWQDRNYPHAAD